MELVKIREKKKKANSHVTSRGLNEKTKCSNSNDTAASANNEEETITADLGDRERTHTKESAELTGVKTLVHSGKVPANAECRIIQETKCGNSIPDSLEKRETKHGTTDVTNTSITCSKDCVKTETHSKSHCDKVVCVNTAEKGSSAKIDIESSVNSIQPSTYREKKTSNLSFSELNAAINMNKSFDSEERVHTVGLASKQLYPKLNIESTFEAHHSMIISSRDVLLNKTVELANKSYEEFYMHAKQASSHEFFELVFNYYCARRDLLIVQDRVTSLEFNLANKEKELWKSVTEQVTSRGMCQDQSSVQVTQKYSIMKFDETVENEMALMLKELENKSLTDLAYYEYSSQVLRHKIEIYIQCLSKKFGPEAEQSLSSFSSLNDCSSKVKELKICISVLFHFQRKLTRDEEFIVSSRKWLTKLISLLPDTDTFDKLFVLHHILRCPGGINSWAVSYIQQNDRVNVTEDDVSKIFESDFIKFSLSTLLVILSPIHTRDEFLKAVPGCEIHKGECPDECCFTIIDAGGDEHEVQYKFGKQFNEQDILGLLGQIQLSKVFQQPCFSLPENSSSLVLHENLCDKHMKKIITFTYLFLELCDTGLKTFADVGYSSVMDKIGEILVCVVKFLNRQWIAVKEQSQQCSFCIQIEIDRAVFHAVYLLLSSKQNSTFKTLSHLPYDGVSPKVLWNLLWLYHCFTDSDETMAFSVKDVPEKLKVSSCRALLQNKLKDMGEEEVLYCLEAMKNMALSKGSENEFVHYTALEIFEVATSRMLDKDVVQEAFKFLCEIAESHLIVISFLLRHLNSTPDSDLKAAATLFKMLPFQNWVPEDNDFDIISDLLLSGTLTSHESRLARVVLKRMNWCFERSSLALTQELHQKVAILILKAFKQYDKNEEGWSVTRGIKQVLRLYMPVFSDEESDDGFPAWAWHMLFQLKLHALSQLYPSYVEIFDGEVQSIDLPNLHSETWLQPILSAYSEQHPVACYLVLVMTNIGHSIRTLSNEGLQIFSILMQNKQYAAATQVLFFLLPFFVRNSETLTGNERFLSDLKDLITIDRLNKQDEISKKVTVGAILLTVQDIIKKQFCLASKFSIEIVCPLMKLWVKILTKLLLENKNELKYNGSIQQVYFLLDFIFKFAFHHPYTQASVMEELMTLTKNIAQMPESKKTIWQSWFDSSVQLSPLLQDITSSHCWYAYAVIQCEVSQTAIAELWTTVVKEMTENSRLTPESAIKKSSSSDCTCLPIFRWATQALQTPSGHPLLPLVMQNFFIYYLQRNIGPPGFHWSQGTSLGPKFFEGSTLYTLFAKLKQKLCISADYYHEQATKAEAEYKPISHKESGVVVNQKKKNFDKATNLFLLFRAFSVWIEDASLHGIVCLQALSPEYLVSKLKLILANDIVPWLEYVDFDSIKDECFLKEDILNPVYPPCSSFVKSDCDEPVLELPPQPLPRVEIEPLIPEVADCLLFTSPENLSIALKENQKLICKEAQKFELGLSKLKQLNQKYMSLIPNEYSLEDKEVVLKSPCYRMSRCQGNAVIKVMTKKSVQNEKILTIVSLNRNEFKKLLSFMITPPTNDIYAAAVQMELIIRKLVSLVKSSSDGGESVEHLKKLSISLFYDQLIKAREIFSYGSIASVSYMPSKQFFSTCIDILGKELIMEYNEECKTLLKVLLENPAAAELASPYFCPDKLAPNEFLDIYEEIVKSISSVSKNVVFVILSKVNLKKWLSTMRPSYYITVQLLSIMFDGFCICGDTVDDMQISLVEDIIKKHFRILLMHEFPELFPAALENILKGLESNIQVEIFYELFQCLGCPLNSSEYDTGRIYTALKTFALNRMLTPDQKMYITSPPLLLEQIIAALNELYTFFWDDNERALYIKYKKYMKPLTILFGLLSYSLLEFASESVSLPKEKSRVEHLWNMLQKAFDLWITPWVDRSKSSLQFPWADEEEDDASVMMSIFASCVEFHHLNFKANDCDTSILSYVLDYYAETHVKSGFRSYRMHVFHDAFTAVAWKTFYPTVVNMMSMCEIFQSELPECHKFLSCIFMEIPWPEVLAKFGSGNVSNSRLALTYMMELVVRAGCEHSVLCVKANFQKLLKNLEPFNWDLLGLNDIEVSLSLYVKLYNPRNVICNHDMHLDYYVLQFLKTASGFVSKQEATNFASNDRQLEEKRCLFLEHVVSFFAQPFKFEPLNQSVLHHLCGVIPNYLKEVETLILKDFSTSQYMSVSVPLLEKILSLLNCIENQEVMEKTLNYTITWIRSNPSTPLLLPIIAASGATIKDMSSLTTVVECCIETRYLTEMHDSNEVKSIHNLISSCFKIPESSQNEYIDSCISACSSLCLYEYVLRRVCISDESNSYSMLLKRMLSWLQKMQPDQSNETKLLLIWDQFLGVIEKLIQRNDTAYAVSQIQAFCQYLSSMAQERGSLLGFFSSSPHSVNFRFLCVALAAYLLLQLPTYGGIRMEAYAPGYATETHFQLTSKSSSKTCDPYPSKDGIKAFEDLKLLVSKKQFLALSSQFDRLAQYVFDPKHSFVESRSVLKELALQVFPNQMYLHLLNTTIL